MTDLLLPSAKKLEEKATCFQHFLITRINIDWNISRPLNNRNDLNFLSYRFKIFEQTCYPSINAQTNKNFIWLLLLDAEIPSQFKERVENYSSNPAIKPVFITNQATCLEKLRKAINTHLLESTRYIITTNLDSDDAITDDFMDTVQSQFREQNFEFINFPFGYLYRFENQKLYLREWLKSPVYTLIEKSSIYDTVLKYSHDQITKYNIRQVFTKPMWLMTAHGKNVRTRFDEAAAWQPLFKVGNSFHVKIDFPQQTLLMVFREMLYEIKQIITSTSEVNTIKVKLRKIINILFPVLISLNRKIQYYDWNTASIRHHFRLINLNLKMSLNTIKYDHQKRS